MKPTPEDIQIAVELWDMHHLTRDDEISVVAAAIAQARKEGHDVGYNAAVEDAAKRTRVFQDIVNWQPGENRNRLIQEIETAIRALHKP